MADNMIQLALSDLSTRDSYQWGKLATSAKPTKKKATTKAKGG
jgi:hypothetical protein